MGEVASYTSSLATSPISGFLSFYSSERDSFCPAAGGSSERSENEAAKSSEIEKSKFEEFEQHLLLLAANDMSQTSQPTSFYPENYVKVVTDSNDADSSQNNGEKTHNTSATEGNTIQETNIQSNATKKHKKTKKCRVSFADSSGKDLTSVRVFSESSYDPPVKCTNLRLAIERLATSDNESRSSLTIEFPQPAADYLKFRDKLDANHVSLENVITPGDNVTGSIKVSNLSYNKRVFIRWTVDNWQTHTDTVAHHIQTDASQFTSFQFNLGRVLQGKHVLEFAVCFISNDTEYWDNNDSRNYRIVRQPPVAKSRFIELHDIPDDNIMWSDFSSNILSSDRPYW